MTTKQQKYLAFVRKRYENAKVDYLSCKDFKDSKGYTKEYIQKFKKYNSLHAHLAKLEKKISNNSSFCALNI